MKAFCLDANFGLVRRHLSGTNNTSPRMEDGFFVPQEEVDAYVDSYDDLSTQRHERAVSSSL